MTILLDQSIVRIEKQSEQGAMIGNGALEMSQSLQQAVILKETSQIYHECKTEHDL